MATAGSPFGPVRQQDGRDVLVHPYAKALAAVLAGGTTTAAGVSAASAEVPPTAALPKVVPAVPAAAPAFPLAGPPLPTIQAAAHVHAAQQAAAWQTMVMGQVPAGAFGMMGVGVPAINGVIAVPGFVGVPALPAVPVTVTPFRSSFPLAPVGAAATSGQTAASLRELYRPAQRPKVGPKQPLPPLTKEDLADPEALLEAADRRDEPRCRALVAHEGFKHINQKGPDGRTALHVCLLRKLPEDLCLAILHRPDFTELNAVDTFGNTLLIFAASKGMGQLCKAILEREEFSGINAQDHWGSTALHWAADQDLADVCAALLSNPAFVEVNRRAWSFAFENKTALDVAENRNCRAAARVLRDHLGR